MITNKLITFVFAVMYAVTLLYVVLYDFINEKLNSTSSNATAKSGSALF